VFVVPPPSPDCDPARDQVKRVLYYGVSHDRFLALVEALAAGGRAGPMREAAPLTLTIDGVETQWVHKAHPDDTRACLQGFYVNLLVLDLRWSDRFEEDVALALELLRDLDHAEDLELRYGFHRILVLLSGPEDDRIDALIAQLGAMGIRHILRERRADEAYGVVKDDAARAFVGKLGHRAVSLMAERTVGPSALCLSGGGITGIYFEMGALKCLDDCLVGKGVNDFDMMFGISAGAVVSSLLAVGYTVDEMMAAIAGVEGGRIPPLDLSLLHLGHLNRQDMAERLRSGMRTARHAVWDFVRGRGRPHADALFLEYTALIGPPFQSGEFEAMLRRVLTVEGGTNDFRELPHRLFIGASDQDLRTPMLFGDEQNDEVPISQAVQASLSVNPAFASVPIGGRYYEDGAITRTSNFVEAIKRSAKLVFIFDPFVPYIAKTPGTVHQRGMLYNIDQDIRTITFTRFERTRDLVLRKHPEVSSYTFLPSNSARLLLSVNPMDHRPFLPIWRGAYLSTLQRIHQLCHRMRGDVVEHGMRIDTTRAETVARQLASANVPTFADFYVDRRVEIRTRPLLS